MSARLEQLRRDIAIHAEAVASLVPEGARVTVIVRNAQLGGAEDDDVIVSPDHAGEVLDVVERWADGVGLVAAAGPAPAAPLTVAETLALAPIPWPRPAAPLRLVPPPKTAEDLAQLEGKLHENLARLDQDLQLALAAAAQALRSYQYGNAAPELAREVADHIEAVLAAARKAGGE